MPFAQMYGEILDFRVKVQEQQLALEEKDERLAKAGLEIDRLKEINDTDRCTMRKYQEALEEIQALHLILSSAHEKAAEDNHILKQRVELLEADTKHSNNTITTLKMAATYSQDSLKRQTQIAEDAVQKRIEVEEKHQSYKTNLMMKMYGGGAQQLSRMFTDQQITDLEKKRDCWHNSWLSFPYGVSDRQVCGVNTSTI